MGSSKVLGYLEPREMRLRFPLLLLLVSGFALFLLLSPARFTRPSPFPEQCRSLNTPAGKPIGYDSSERTVSDRYVEGTYPVLIRNAKILTGARNGTEIVFGDILLDGGVVQAIGYVPSESISENANVVDAHGKWITPGLVDLHSHLGVHPLPILSGSSDGNSRHQPINPFLRSIDGLNTHDEAYKLTVSGGVTTAQILPGSANNIGGQAVLIKLRPTAERSVSSLVLEPPKTLFINSTSGSDPDYIPWRHMKHACGENPDRLYGQTRMDAIWNFRHAYDRARILKEKQDKFCSNVKAQHTQWGWRALFWKDQAESGEFPEDLELEALVDVLRGRVKLSIHCYEAVDFDGIVRLSNEFRFPVASVHHAGEAYLVADLLKKTWGGSPAAAIFASNARKKREAYRGSEFAPRILADNGVPVVMKTDHPVLNARYLLYEASKARYYGLPAALAIASVTQVPADAAGVGWRVGKLSKGYDADLVIWDSHPLALGATPTQVYIDGIPQLENPHVLTKPGKFQVPPRTPNWDKEINDTITWEGLPPLDRPLQGVAQTKFRLFGVKSYWARAVDDNVHGEVALKAFFDEFDDMTSPSDPRSWTVLVEDGKVSCYETESSFFSAGCKCCSSVTLEDFEDINLEGGSITPGLTSFGSPLGLVEIRLEPSTNDGPVLDPFTTSIPTFLGNETIIRAVDGLQFGGRNTLLAYRGGVTKAITAPTGPGFLQGLSTAFDVGARHALENGAIIQTVTALHVTLSLDLSVSVSTQIATLRAKLLHHSGSDAVQVDHWDSVRTGQIPLVIRVDSADIMASLIKLKYEVEEANASNIRLTFVGGAEAPLLAKEISKAGVTIVFIPPRPFPTTWESQRIVAGPPLTRDSQITTLLAAGVRVAIGVKDEYDARNLRFDIGWAALESNSTISKGQALALGSINVEHALGLDSIFGGDPDLIFHRGGDFSDMQSRIVGIIRREKVDFFV